MTTMSMKALVAFSFLALAAAPALAREDHADASTQSENAKSATPPLMFETPYQKWWTRGED